MGEQILLERFFWFHQEARNQRFPNASTLAHRFECSVRTAQRDIDYFRCRLHAIFRGSNAPASLKPSGGCSLLGGQGNFLDKWHYF
ncbi:MAG: hypothetical protein M0P74_02110 [Syntrophales bacterium]|nr:hypothetical protein [Syntrophales bacterium]